MNTPTASDFEVQGATTKPGLLYRVDGEGYFTELDITSPLGGPTVMVAELPESTGDAGDRA